MAIDVKDLPPAYQAQVLRKIMEQERMQVDFTLQEAYTDGEGRRVRAIRYKADFVYERRDVVAEAYVNDKKVGKKIVWNMVVEDVKSRATQTKEYILKRKLMKERFNIDIQEV